MFIVYNTYSIMMHDDIHLIYNKTKQNMSTCTFKIKNNTSKR